MAPSLQFQFFVVLVAGWLERSQQEVIDYLRTEVAVLREQLGDQKLRLTDEQRRRLARAGKPLGRRGLADVASLVTPDTLLRWFRKLVAKKYDGTPRRRGGKPKTAAKLAALVVKVATENVAFGYTRIRDTLHHVGHDLDRSTVRRILDERGIVPAPERKRQTRWADFLRAHAETLCAADFFSVEVLTRRGIARIQVFFVLHVATRRVHVAGIARAEDVTGAWMLQVARNLTDSVDGFLRRMQFLILDRDPAYTAAFRQVLRDAGMNVVRLPRESPNLSAHAERWVRSIREECLDRMLICGEAHLRHLVHGYVAHHQHERPHQGLGSEFVDADPRARNRSGAIRRVDHLGGLLRFYHRAAA